jgi:hypothetical protein
MQPPEKTLITRLIPLLPKIAKFHRKVKPFTAPVSCETKNHKTDQSRKSAPGAKNRLYDLKILFGVKRLRELLPGDILTV